MKKIKNISFVFVTLLLFSACVKPIAYKDGSYEQKTTIVDDYGGYGLVKLQVTDGAIANCEFLLFNGDDTLKDETYGKVPGKPELYTIAQNTLKTAPVYAEALVKTQNIETVDAISGATQNHELFVNASTLILEKIEVKK